MTLTTNFTGYDYLTSVSVAGSWRVDMFYARTLGSTKLILAWTCLLGRKIPQLACVISYPHQHINTFVMLGGVVVRLVLTRGMSVVGRLISITW